MTKNNNEVPAVEYGAAGISKTNEKDVNEMKEIINLIDTDSKPVFINESGLEFTDVTSEEFRTYDFPESGSITVKNPIYLNVSKNGHRLFDEEGISHYIPFGWRHLYWKTKVGKANFVK
jgi:hypothetical protein